MVEDHGRKFAVAILVIIVGVLGWAVAAVGIFIAGVYDIELDTGQLVAAGGILTASTTVAASLYTVANAWSKQAEAKVEAARIEVGVELPEE